MLKNVFLMREVQGHASVSNLLAQLANLNGVSAAMTAPGIARLYIPGTGGADIILDFHLDEAGNVVSVSLGQ